MTFLLAANMTYQKTRDSLHRKMAAIGPKSLKLLAVTLLELLQESRVPQTSDTFLRLEGLPPARHP